MENADAGSFDAFASVEPLTSESVGAVPGVPKVEDSGDASVEDSGDASKGAQIGASKVDQFATAKVAKVEESFVGRAAKVDKGCLLYTSPSPRDRSL